MRNQSIKREYVIHDGQRAGVLLQAMVTCGGNEMGRLAIIADDLTSATDCGIQMARGGLQTQVLLTWNGIASAAEAVDVLSIDTDSRTVPVSEAYERVSKAASLVVAAGFSNIYKSLDSTLRGNLGAEVDAVLDVFDVNLAAVTPAFPLYGRTILNGKHFLHGQPITTTEFAADPQCPVREGDVVQLFASQSKRKVGLVPLAVLRDGNDAVARALAAFIANGVELAVFDAELESDLDRIAGAVAASGHRVLWVGSTGLARSVPVALGMRARRGPRPGLRSARKQIMLVVGSASEVTDQQLRTLMQECEVAPVKMSPLRVIGGARGAASEIERCRSRVLQRLREGKDVALCVAGSREAVGIAQSRGRGVGLTSLEVSARIVMALGRITQLVMDAHELRGVILTGGDTAKAVCRGVGAIGIRIWHEVEPGIALGQLIGGDDVLIVTKGGAIGTPRALIKSVEALKERV